MPTYTPDIELSNTWNEKHIEQIPNKENVIKIKMLISVAITITKYTQVTFFNS